MQDYEAEDKSHLSFIPWDNSSKQQAGCCAPSECWDGENCVDSIHTTMELEEPYKIMNDFGDGFICVDGDWEWAYKKKTWVGDNSGYCLENTQCLVDPDSDISLVDTLSPTKYDLEDVASLEYPRCIDSGEYYLDHYCENGAWTSRTKYVALELYNLGQSSGDYTLYCDNYNQVLNNVNYYIPGSYSSINETFFDATQNMACYNYNGEIVPCINHMCLLVDKGAKENKIYLGMSLNMNPKSLVVENNGLISDFGEVFGTTLDGCDPNSTSLKPCGSDDLYYNAEKNILVFSRSGVGRSTNFFNVMKNLFMNFVKSLVEGISKTPARIGYDYSLFESLADTLFNNVENKSLTRDNFVCDNCVDNNQDGNKIDEVCGVEGNPKKIYDFNTFYLSSNGDKKIFGMAEIESDVTMTPFRMVGMVFEGFKEDVCESFEHPRLISGYKCVNTGEGKYIILSRPSLIDKDISYESIVDVAPWEQWVFLGPSTRLQK